MSHWNNRIVRVTNPDMEHDPDGDWPKYEYRVHEAYYNNDGDICGLTGGAVEPYGNSIEELKAVLERMLKACDDPILDADKIDYASWSDDDNKED